MTALLFLQFKEKEIMWSVDFKDKSQDETALFHVTLCIMENPKRAPLQKAKTQMKCSIMLHFISVYTVKVKKRSSEKKQIFKNDNLTPLDMYNGLSQVYCIKPEGKSVSIHYTKGLC